MELAAGQSWTYRAPPGYEASRLIIGALVSFAASQRVVCAAAMGAPGRPHAGAGEVVMIPFLPMTEAAFLASVVDFDGEADLPQAFAEKLAAWTAEPAGLPVFTVPFEGYLDRMIAMQMAAIAGQSAA